jgi:hypothetical protein
VAPPASVDFQVVVDPDEDKVKYEGTTSEAEIGDLVRFTVENSEAASFKWLFLGDPAQFEVYDGGRKAVFSAREAGEYRFIVACAKGDTVDVWTHLVIVKEPPKPPTTDSLAEWIPYWLYRSGLPKHEADMISDNYARAAAQITSESTDMTPIYNLILQANRDSLGPSISDWVPILQKTSDHLNKLRDDGKLTDALIVKQVLLDISRGFRSYATS